MTRRLRDFDFDVAKELRTDPEYAKNFIDYYILEEEESLNIAIAELIDQYGQMEFAAAWGKHRSEVSRTVTWLRTNDKPIGLDKLKDILEVVGLGLPDRALTQAIAPIQGSKRA